MDLLFLNTHLHNYHTNISAFTNVLNFILNFLLLCLSGIPQLNPQHMKINIKLIYRHT